LVKAAWTSGVYVPKVSRMLREKLYVIYPNGKSRLVGVRAALLQTGTDGIKQRRVSGWEYGWIR